MIKVAFINVYGQTGLTHQKLFEIENFIQKHRLEIICLQETNVSEDTFLECNYIYKNFYITPNNNKSGYGTCTLVKKNFTVTNVIKDSDGRFICMDIDGKELDKIKSESIAKIDSEALSASQNKSQSDRIRSRSTSFTGIIDARNGSTTVQQSPSASQVKPVLSKGSRRNSNIQRNLKNSKNKFGKGNQELSCQTPIDKFFQVKVKDIAVSTPGKRKFDEIYSIFEVKRLRGDTANTAVQKKPVFGAQMDNLSRGNKPTD